MSWVEARDPPLPQAVSALPEAGEVGVGTKAGRLKTLLATW